MIFNTLRMENIRSYEEEKMTSQWYFPFEGMIGKSTILMAMEFAILTGKPERRCFAPQGLQERLCISKLHCGR